MLRVLLVMMIAGCYQPSFVTCAVRCDQTCPSGQGCGADGFCHAAGETIDCRTAIDAGTDGQMGNDNCMPCEVVSQCGCPGQACDQSATGTFCRASGNGIQATPCAALTDCANGYACLGSSASRACREFCTDDTQCTGNGGICNVTVGTSTQKVCTTSCNPLTSAGCPANWGCHVSKNPNTMRDHTDCHFAGAAGQGASCSALEDCLPGFACIQLNPPRCLKYCVIGGANVCGGATCMPVSGGGLHIGSTEYGVCL